MPSLARQLRKDLETAIKQARTVAEAGARKALDLLAVGHHEPWGSQTPEQRKLRNRLRAHGRQLGDARDTKQGMQAVTRLISEVAYEHWHRLLFGRFLAETDLLIEPDSGVAITLDECRELAREKGEDWLPVACGFAERMLPQIFRRGDPVLDITLPPETRSELEDLLKGLPRDVFLADDSLGWVYQFWQINRKEEIDGKGDKIGADELSAVTQLFTEDYMVEFLLHNTLGAWWAGRCAAISKARLEIANCADENAARVAVALPGVAWTYLRFIKDENAGTWRPAAGTFDEWPTESKALRVLDPCMGSGHFLVFSLPILAAFRVAEEGLTTAQAVHAVLRDNLFGLELDPRCTQIAAFNLALAAWKLGGHQTLPSLHLACSGLSVGAEKEAWLQLADRVARQSPLASDPQLFGTESNLSENLRQRLRFGMGQLHDLFSQAPMLGSLLDPRKLRGEGFSFTWEELRPLVEEALAAEAGDEEASELAVTAKGVAKAAEILAGHFTLVATNVPYLGRGKQNEILKGFCARVYPSAKADLATCFIERCIEFCSAGGSTCLVTPQNWLFLGTYEDLRISLFRSTTWNFVAKLGPAAFQDMNWWAANTVIFILSHQTPASASQISGLDVSGPRVPSQKALEICREPIARVPQAVQVANPDARLLLTLIESLPLLEVYASSLQGISPADFSHYGRFFWELTAFGEWKWWQSTIEETVAYGGRELVLWWNDDLRAAAECGAAFIRGDTAWGKRGVVVRQMRHLPCCLYTGEAFDTNCAVIVPHDQALVPAIWSFCASADFLRSVRVMDQKTNVTNNTLVKVPFDLAYWRTVAATNFPNGLPAPHSDDPNQWLFAGHPVEGRQPLHIGLARLLGYCWPRQAGNSFPDCPAVATDGLEAHADIDGIVPLSALRGEASAAERLNALLAAAFGAEWSAAKLRELLTVAGASSETLDAWLRDEAFAQHCALFQQRPFVWHVWDGVKNGFGAFVNYHQLAAPEGLGRRTLEKLIYTYLGDWIDAQRRDQKAGVEGADGRLAAAEHLRRELEAILVGEPPYDLFIRWKPLHQQPIGWEPDINDGVRLNIRPWMMARPLNARGQSACILRVTPKIKWDKDRGKEPNRPKDEYPWFWGWEKATEEQKSGKEPFLGVGSEPDGNRWNACHYSTAVKRAARERASK